MSLTKCDPKVIVGLDFGTTYSGFSFAHRSDPEDIHIFIDWLGAPRAYCKAQTSLFYVPGKKHGVFRLEDWSWNALEKFVKASKEFRASRAKDGRTLLPEDIKREVGVFVTSFKVLLAEEDEKFIGFLGTELTVEQLVVDYLCSISGFIRKHLREKYGTGFSLRDVQWCLTVPAIWSDKAKQKMHVYAEKAGLVKGKFSRSADASMYPLRIILEPEAASFSCQRQLQGVLSFSQGDKFLVADVGGGTIDIVVHEYNSALDWTHKVHEASASSGALGGGTYVDANFLEFLTKKIGCFDVFRRQEPDVVQKILRWWLGAQGKSTFDGSSSKCLELPPKLSKAWKKHDKAETGFAERGDYYDEIVISAEQMCAIFDTEVDKTIELIKEKLRKVGRIKYIFLVGGFAESAYFFGRIKKRFQSSVDDVLSPPNPGAAVCRGAVALGVGTGVVLSRVSKLAYGIATSRFAKRDDPPASRFIGRDGEERANIFSLFVAKDESVLQNQSITQSYFPIYPKQKLMSLNLLVSDSSDTPRYVIDEGCEVVEKYSIELDEDLHLDTEREVAVTMYFGRSSIEVSARRVNFGSNHGIEKLYSVEFDAVRSYYTNK